MRLALAPLLIFATILPAAADPAPFPPDDAETAQPIPVQSAAPVPVVMPEPAVPPKPATVAATTPSGAPAPTETWQPPLATGIDLKGPASG